MSVFLSSSTVREALFIQYFIFQDDDYDRTDIHIITYIYALYKYIDMFVYRC